MARRLKRTRSLSNTPSDNLGEDGATNTVSTAAKEWPASPTAMEAARAFLREW
jgi:hypothetical protein